MYQFDRPYNFDCSKFISRFKFNPTSNLDAAKFTIESLGINARHQPASLHSARGLRFNINAGRHTHRNLSL